MIPDNCTVEHTLELNLPQKPENVVSIAGGKGWYREGARVGQCHPPGHGFPVKVHADRLHQARRCDGVDHDPVHTDHNGGL